MYCGIPTETISVFLGHYSFTNVQETKGIVYGKKYSRMDQVKSA